MSENSSDAPRFDPQSPRDADAEFRGDPIREAPADREANQQRGPMERFMEAAQSRQSNDEEQEDQLWEGGYSSKAMLGKWVLAGTLTLIGLIVVLVIGLANPLFWVAWLVVSGLLWGGFALYLIYRKLSIKYQLTSQRFIHESGLLKRRTDRIEVIDIDDVSFVQGLADRFVGVGTIKITSSDRSDPELVMQGIENVKTVAGLIDDVRRKERRRRGLHIESI